MIATIVETPQVINFGFGESLASIGKCLKDLLNQNRWNDECTQVMQDNPLALMLYDQFEYFIGNAFGSYFKELKIAYNPLMIQCFHPGCLEQNKKPVKLRKMF